MRQLRNAEFNHIEIECENADARPVFRMQDVNDVALFRLTLSGKRGGPSFIFDIVRAFRASGSRSLADQAFAAVDRQTI